MDVVLYFGGGCIPVLPDLPCADTNAAVSLLESYVVLDSSAPARLVHLLLQVELLWGKQGFSCFLYFSPVPQCSLGTPLNGAPMVADFLDTATGSLTAAEV